MTKLGLLGGGLALGAGGGPALGTVPWDAVAGSLFVLAVGLGLGTLGLVLFWAAPFGTPRAALADPPGRTPDSAPLQVPVLCYRPNGEVEWLVGEVLPTPAP